MRQYTIGEQTIWAAAYAKALSESNTFPLGAAFHACKVIDSLDLAYREAVAQGHQDVIQMIHSIRQ